VRAHTTASESASDSAKRYAREVVAGEIPACSYVRLACARFIRDLARTDWQYWYDETKADRAVRFMETLPHTKGKWAAKHELLVLQPWQRFIECNLFGWVHKDTGLRRFREAYEEVPRKNGKALAIETPIATPQGWKRHGDLKPGDSVFGKDGQIVKVLAVTEHYSGPCHEIAFRDCAPIIAHEAHEWMTQRTWYTKKAKGSQAPHPPVESAELLATLTCGSRGDFVHRIAVCGALQLPDIPLPIAPYTLGAWLGDGSSANQNITSADEEVLCAIKADGYPIRQIHSNGSKATTYSMWNGDRRFAAAATSLKSSLRRVGVLHNKHIPSDYLRGSYSQRLELLRGLLDTDGHITKRGQIQFCNVNKRLIDGVSELVRTLGMKPTVREGRATISGRDIGPKWMVEFFTSTEESLFKIDRKRQRQCFLGKGKRRCRSRTVVGADRCGDRLVNCIEVEGGLYLAGDGLVPTHNSQRLAARGIYLFCADGESGAEVYSGATTEKQAYEVYRPAWMMVSRQHELREHFSVEQAGNSKNPGPMYVTEDLSRFEPMIGKPGDGASVHAALIDEYHEHATDEMVDTMKTGMGAREQPLLSYITTAGTNLSGPCYEKRKDVIRILEGQVEDETQFGVIFTLDEGDDWQDESSLIKANPNYGISIFPEFLLSQLTVARRSATKQSAFRTKHLNQWVGARTLWMNMLAWQRQRRLMQIRDFAGCRCWIAADLASKIDVAALTCLFEKDGQWHVIPRFYVPESAVEDNPKYQSFIAAGEMIATPGSMIDQAFIEEDILSIAAQVNLQDIGFDEWQANYLIARLQNTSLKDKVIIYNQIVQNMSDPMKEVEARILARKLWHDGNSCMTWMMGNVAAKVNAKDHIYPRKDNDNDPLCKIDGPVSLIMCAGRALANTEPEKQFQMLVLG
jgi:phage terminase large subunit-like protein